MLSSFLNNLNLLKILSILYFSKTHNINFFIKNFENCFLKISDKKIWRKNREKKNKKNKKEIRLKTKKSNKLNEANYSNYMKK